MKKIYIRPEVSDQFDVVTSMLCSSQEPSDDKYDPRDGSYETDARSGSITTTPSASTTFTEQAQDLYGEDLDGNN